MIKINLNDPDVIVLEHFNALKDSVENKLGDEIANAKKEKKEDLESFLEFLKRNIKTILTGRREELEKLITKIEKEHYISVNKLEDIQKEVIEMAEKTVEEPTVQLIMEKCIIDNNLIKHFKNKKPLSIAVFKLEIKGLIDKWNSYKNILENVFSYKNFSKEKKSWSAYSLVTRLNISVCPYCNRTYTTTLRKIDKNGKMTRPELDHYYPKFRYQYLGLSFYNLIPSCSVCNSRLKNQVDFYKNEAVNPYDEEFLNVATFVTDFNYDSEDSYKYLLGYSTDFKISFEINTEDEELRNKVENSIKTFDLERIYNTHQDIVNDLIRNSRIYTKERIEEIYREFPNMFETEEEVLQSLFLNYMSPEDLGKRPFSKLTQDIYNELGLKDNIK